MNKNISNGDLKIKLSERINYNSNKEWLKCIKNNLKSTKDTKIHNKRIILINKIKVKMINKNPIKIRKIKRTKLINKFNNKNGKRQWRKERKCKLIGKALSSNKNNQELILKNNNN